jgi:hypothetical protein
LTRATLKEFQCAVNYPGLLWRGFEEEETIIGEQKVGNARGTDTSQTYL